MSATKAVDVTDGAKPGCIYFESGSAVFNDSSEERPEFKEVSDISPPSGPTLAGENSGEIDQLIAQLEQNGEENIPRITLIGRADDEKPSKYYLSNYELSEARINFVKSRIIDRLHTKDGIWQNIEWISVPVSNEIREKKKS